MTSPHLHRNKFIAATAMITLLLGACGGTPAVRPAEEKAAAATDKGTPATAATPPAVELPPRVQSDYLMAVNTYKAGNLKASESFFATISQSYPNLPGPHANLGTIHLKRGDLDRAEAELNQALTLKPDQAEVYNQLGIIYRNKGQFDKALQNYQAGLKLAPDNPNLLLNIGILYDLYLNQPEEALKQWQHYRTLVKEDKQVDTWIADINQRSKPK